MEENEERIINVMRDTEYLKLLKVDKEAILQAIILAKEEFNELKEKVQEANAFDKTLEYLYKELKGHNGEFHNKFPENNYFDVNYKSLLVTITQDINMDKREILPIFLSNTGIYIYPDNISKVNVDELFVLDDLDYIDIEKLENEVNKNFIPKRVDDSYDSFIVVDLLLTNNNEISNKIRNESLKLEEKENYSDYSYRTELILDNNKNIKDNNIFYIDSEGRKNLLDYKLNNIELEAVKEKIKEDKIFKKNNNNRNKYFEEDTEGKELNVLRQEESRYEISIYETKEDWEQGEPFVLDTTYNLEKAEKLLTETMKRENYYSGIVFDTKTGIEERAYYSDEQQAEIEDEEESL